MASTAFVPNGLLDSAFVPDGDSTFVPNGLLAEPATQSLTTSLSQDDFPPVAEVLGISPPSQSASRPAESSSRAHIKATTFDGKTIWMKRKLALPKTKTTLTNAQIGNLLDVPIHRMLDELAVDTAQRLNNLENQPQNVVSRSSDVDNTLWVDRYRPQRFMELMGNERAARDTLTWVKQWDWCVFGKNKGKKRLKDENDNEDEHDEYQRPKQKILLIHGPPGLGKTTLAHVVARHAGYSVMEINASDARSAQIVDDRIRPALESGSAVGSSKPVLLVIDEIDGATGGNENTSGFINSLIQLTLGKSRKKGRRPKDSTAQRPILRPIICICNDINAAALTKLRPIASQVRYQRPADVHTVKRLRELCELEGLKADSRAISTLVGIAKGDLRGCINTLQFIKSRNEDVTEAVIRRATHGMREGDSTIASVLNNLFVPLPKKRVKELGMNDEEENRYVARLSHEIDACGKESTIATGCFAHYVTLRRHDASFSHYEKANEWLGTFDIFSATMYTDGDFALNQYLPYTLAPFFPLFSERGNAKVERNQADWDNLQRTRSNEEIYKSLARCLQTASTRRGGDFRHLVSTPILQVEFVPLLNRIISPPLRPVNSQIIKPEEKALLSRLVNIMASLELRFFQERADDGQLTYRLDPPIDVFITYDGKRAADIAVSRYSVRHLVAAEIEAELAKRQVHIIEKGKRGKHEFFGKRTEIANESVSPSKRPADSDALDSEHTNKRARTELADIADRPPTDFFGRPLERSNIRHARSAKQHVEKKFRVLYKFREGNSAAVRKPVKMSAFL